MRYHEMMNRLDHVLGDPEVPAKPDAVLVLEPGPNAPSNWPRVSNVARTPDKINGKFIADFLDDAQPLPKEAIPRSVSIEKYIYRYAQEDGIDREWPAGLPQVMPDLFSLRHQCFIVSSTFREALETHCSGCVEYIEVTVDTPSEMIRASEYYYINVLSQAQMVDWTQVDMEALGLGGRPRGNPISPQWGCEKAIPYKPFGPNDPLIWHEMSLDEERRSMQGDVMVRGCLWNALIERFPLQFMNHMQLSRDV